MALTISNIGSILKKVIIPIVQSELPKESILWDKIKRNSGVTITNNTIYIASRVGRHSGIYSVAEGTEPRVGKSTYGNPYTSVKYAFGTLELTDQAIEAAGEGDKKAIASILATEIKALKDDFRKDINRQWWGYGDGVLCLTNGTGATGNTSVVVDTPGTRYLDAGMYIELGTGSAFVIVAKTSGTTITCAALTGGGTPHLYTDNLAVVKENSAEMMGLQGIIDGGTGSYVTTIQNIARADNLWARCQTSATTDTAATLTEAQLISIYLQCLEYGRPDVVFTGPTGFSKYGALLTSMKRTADLKEVLAGGWKGLEFMDIGVVLDYDCPEQSTTSFGYYFVDFDTLTIAEMCEPFKWLEADAHGGILKRSASVRTNWEGTLKYYANLVGKTFQSNGRVIQRSA
uniref:Putative capsid protein n=1 Tax=viral metagenome TaxID=1070528 RepID=A0A6M3XPD9_9ZZZZ